MNNSWNQPTPRKPDYIAYTVRQGRGRDNFWTKIGACFEHRDSEGFDLLLDALPTDGRVTLRRPKEDIAQNKQHEEETS